MIDEQIRPSVFLTKRRMLEEKGGEIVDEDSEGVTMFFPDGTGCTLSYFGKVEWFKAV